MKVSFSSVVGLGLLILLCIVPFVANEYAQYLANLSLVFVLAAMGFNVILGYAGQISLANAALFGIGAYFCGMAIRHFGWDWLPAFVAGVIVAAMAGLLIGIPSSRLQRYFFAIATLVFAEVVSWLELFGGNVTFGARGFDLPSPTLLNIPLASQGARYVATAIIVVAVLLALRGLLTSRFGRAFVATRGNELIAQAMGIDAYRAKLLAFSISAIITGIAGSLYVLVVGRVSPDAFTRDAMLFQLMMVIVGGLGAFWGVLISGVGLTWLHASLAGLRGFEDIVFGLSIVGLMLFAPRGLSALIANRSTGLSDELVRRSTISSSNAATAWARPAVAPSSEELLLVRGLSVRFGGLSAVEDVTLHLRHGDILGLIGPNGAGKSTFINAVTGFIPHVTGEVWYDGVRIDGLPAHEIARLGVARTFQKGGLFPEMTVLENMLTGYEPHFRYGPLEAALWLPRGQREETEANARASELLALLGVSKLAHTEARQLSGGESRLVEVARLLIRLPKLLILDEPLVGLSLTSRAMVIELLQRLNREFGIGMLIVEHATEVVPTLCHRVNVLDLGRMVFDGAPSAMVEAHQVMEAYFGR